MEVIKPHLTKNVCCVYKMEFSNKEFYIGSTTNLLIRINSHLSSIKKGTNSKRILEAAIKSSRVIFSILKNTEQERLRDSELEFIKGCFTNSLCLNIRQCAASLLSFKSEKLKIGQFDLKMNLIKTFQSICEAEKSIGCGEGRLRSLIKGYGKTHKSCIWRKLDVNGNPIEPVEFRYRNNKYRKYIKKGRQPSKFSKPILKYLNGELIDTLPSITAAANSVGSDRKTTKRAIAKGWKNHGYVFKYA